VIVRSFLKWYDTAPAHERVEAVQMLAQAYLAGELGSDTPEEAEAALTLALDDAALSVRRALAWALALSDKAPHHIIVALAHDHADVSALILARAPQLRDADLIDCIRSGDRLSHLAIAMRADLSPAVTAELTARAEAEPLLALLENPAVVLCGADFERMLARHEGCGRLREALIRRADLPAAIRHRLVSHVSEALLGLMTRTGWVDKGRAARVVADARETASIDLAGASRDLDGYVEHLRASGALTPSLLLRSLLCGETALIGAALVCLAGLAPRRVAGMLAARSPGAFIAAYHKAGLPRATLPAFVAALEAIRDLGDDGLTAPSLRRPIIRHVLAACLREDEDEMRPVLALLRRFDAEAARAEARAMTERLKEREQAVVLEAAEVPALDLAPLIEASLNERTLDAVAEALEMPDAVYAIAEAPETEAAAMIAEAANVTADGAQESEAIASDPVNAFQQRLEQIVAGRTLFPVAVDAALQQAAQPGVPRLSEDLEALFAKAFSYDDELPLPLVVREDMAPAAPDAFAGWDLRRSAA